MIKSKTSVIIPVLNDNEKLTNLLQAFRYWNEQPLEIIVVDAENDPKCRNICEQFEATHLPFKKTRGAQQRHGAQHASGENLWFLHADCYPYISSLISIRQTLKSHKGGFFKFAFDVKNKNLTHKFLEACINWRSKYFTPYGDQGLFFDKATYFALDGHADQTLFEEVALIKKMRSHGFKQCNIPIFVSPRKWEKDGYWKRTLQNRLFALKYHFGVSSEKIKEQYYSDN